MFHQRHSFFPLVLAGLTLVLIIFMFYAFTEQGREPVSVMREPSPVSAQAYEKQWQQITQAFEEMYPNQSDDLARLVLTEQTIRELLELRVPAQQKDFHLSLVIELNQIAQALRARSGEASEAFARFQQILKKPYVQN